MPVNTRHRSYQAFIDRWDRCRTCADGEDTVKAAGLRFLPPLDIHVDRPELYDAYRKRAFYYNATGRTVEALSGVVSQKPPTFKLPIEEHLEDITLTGVPAQAFVAEVICEIVNPGRAGVLVEMSTSPDPKAVPRPYWCLYKAEDIVNWQVAEEYGDQKLTMVVIRESAEERDAKDPFVMKPYESYRVLELVNGVYTSSVWRKKSDMREEWIKESETVPQRKGAPLSFIPFTFINPRSIGTEPSKPPLLDLVNVNLSHYRNSADFEHGLHYTGTPIPYIAGAPVGGPKSGKIQLGPSSLLQLEKGATVGIVQANGEMLGALSGTLKSKEKLMATLGARILEDQPAVAETATGIVMRHAGEHASLKSITETVELGLTVVARWHAWLVGTGDLGDVNAGVELNKDFFGARMQPGELQALVGALQDETISYETFYYNITRGELTRPGIDYTEEKQAILEHREEMTPEEPELPEPPEEEPSRFGKK